MRLRIRYRDSEGELTERDISDLEFEDPAALSAYCHLRNEQRTFALRRIENAVDLSTGEHIPDIWKFLGLQSPKPEPLERPSFSGRRQVLSVEESAARRKADKYQLYRRCKYPVIADAFRNKLRDLFGNACFRCGGKEQLVFDHHIPQHLSGRLVPGNIVLLCAQCNLAKRDKHPSQFYPSELLATLEELFEEQLRLFSFAFDWDHWNRDPRGYLLSLGVSEENVEIALTDIEHRYYIPRYADELESPN